MAGEVPKVEEHLPEQSHQPTGIVDRPEHQIADALKEGQKLSYADVTVDETRPIVAMRRLQDAMLANGTLGRR